MAEQPRSASYEATIQSIMARLAGLPGIHNPERLLAANQAAAALNREGYTDSSSYQQDATDAAGNVTYRLVRGLDGRLYRQRFRQTNAQFAAQGTAGSSFAQRAMKDDKRELDTARESAIQGFQAGQSANVSQQAGEYRDYSDQLGGANAEYADWRAQQPVALPSPIAVEPSVTPVPSVGAPPVGSGINSATQQRLALPGGPDQLPLSSIGPDQPGARRKPKPLTFWGGSFLRR